MSAVRLPTTEQALADTEAARREGRESMPEAADWRSGSACAALAVVWSFLLGLGSGLCAGDQR